MCGRNRPRSTASEANRACVRDPDSLKNRNNGEEDELRNPTTGELSYAANFTKGMPLHPDADAEELGEVDPEAYERMLGAVNSESPVDFGGIPLGGDRRFVDPQNGLTFDLQGSDAPSTWIYDRDLEPRPYLNAPRFDSDWFAAEIAETYWMAILRDKHVSLFHENTEDDDIRRAADNLSQFRDYRGPRSRNNEVSGQELFRGGNVNAHQTPVVDPHGEVDGSTIGPLVSQLQLIGSRIDEGNGLTNQFFASRVIPPDTSTGLTLKRSDGLVTFGTLVIDQKQWEISNGLDFMGGYNEWLAIQRGDLPAAKNEFTGQRRFLYNLRQLAHYVHFDITYQPALVAALLLLSMQERAERIGIDLFDPDNPYLQPGAANQEGFGMFGNGHVVRSVGEAATRGLQAVWNGKFFNQRRLRPEAAAGRITNILRGLATRERYGFPPVRSELFDDPHGQAALEAIRVFNEEQGHEYHLLPQGYPEGSPLHPAYPAGHAAMIGAGATVLKAHFNEDFPITDAFLGDPDPEKDFALIPNDDGTKLDIYTGPGHDEALSLGRELNKLASNISIARNMAGVHYRVDYSESIQIGEYAALGMLQEQARSFNPNHSFTLTLFSGRKVKIKAGGEIEVL